jgi:hypothetical protein
MNFDRSYARKFKFKCAFIFTGVRTLDREDYNFYW